MKCALLLLALAAAAAPAFAAEDAFEFYKEEAEVVTTASRRPEPAWRAPAAVDVITAEDIKAYGFKELWDALRYRAGVDVVDGNSLDGNRALVSVRGFDREFVEELQVLVDGRPVYSPFLGGVYWESLPVQMQDIQRIEIVRGPNAALYGSNAGLGVINIITKKPAAASGAAASAFGGTRGQVGTAETATAGTAAGGLKISHTYRAEDGQPNANGVGDGNDFLHMDKLNVNGVWKPDAATEVDLLGGGSWLTAGLPGLAGSPQTRHVEGFGGARATRSLGGGDAIEASVSHSDGSIDNQPLFLGDVHVRTRQNDFEVLHRFSWLDERAKSSWGADWRESSVESDQAFTGGPYQSNRIVRGFMHHSVRVAGPLTAVAGASIEHSGTGGTQPAWQAAALYEPVSDQVLRASYSRAPTIPPMFSKNGNYALSSTEHFVGNASLSPQQLSSWELGWNGRLLDGDLRPSVALYYMDIRDRNFNFARVSGGNTTFSLDNRNAALARGAELSVEYALGPGRAAFANYTFEDITASQGPDAFGDDPRRSTPDHAFNVGARAALPRGFTAAAVVGYKNDYQIASDSRGTTVAVPRTFRLDARLAWTPRPGWELFVAGQNLLQPYTVEYADGVANPRTVRAGLSARLPP